LYLEDASVGLVLLAAIEPYCIEKLGANREVGKLTHKMVFKDISILKKSTSVYSVITKHLAKGTKDPHCAFWLCTLLQQVRAHA